jgi:hypothetical protein
MSKIFDIIFNIIKKDKGINYLLNNFALILQPSKFFKNIENLDSKLLIFMASWIVGASSQVNTLYIQAEEIMSCSCLVEPLYLSNWKNFWARAFKDGIQCGLIAWYIGGWIFNGQLILSDAINHNRHYGKIVFIVVSLFCVLPIILTALYFTYFYDNLKIALADNITIYNMSNMIIYNFCFVLILTLAAHTCFKVNKIKAFFWITISPIVIPNAYKFLINKIHFIAVI